MSNRNGVPPGIAGANMAEKIKRLREALGMRQVEFAKCVEVDQSIVSKWERGLQEPNAERTARLAALAGMSYEEWMGLKLRRVTPGDLRTYKIVGELRAGAWREAVEWPYDDQYDLAMPRPRSEPDIPLQGYIVRGNSMNQLYPDGTIVFVAGTISNRIHPKHGDKVLVQRRNADGLIEATLKEYVVGEDGEAWLWPRSTDPEYQSPISYRDARTEEVTITGIVRAMYASV